MIRKILCYLGLHKWERNTFDFGFCSKPERTCSGGWCPACKYFMKRKCKYCGKVKQ